MARQIDKGAIRKYIQPEEKKVAKKLHRRQKRREAKRLDSDNPQHNKYTDGWVM